MSFLADVLAHSSFFMAFLVGFYFLYVTKIQVNALVNDLFTIIKDPLTNVDLLTPNLKSVISDAIGSISLDSDPKLQKTMSKNPSIVKYTAITVGILAPLLLAIAIWLQYSSGGSIFDLLLGNLIVIFFIACAEFAIVGIFMGSFVEIDKDFVKSVLSLRLASQESEMMCNFVYKFIVSTFPSFVSKEFYPDQTSNNPSNN
jgi:hypothetical protein